MRYLQRLAMSVSQTTQDGAARVALPSRFEQRARGAGSQDGTDVVEETESVKAPSPDHEHVSPELSAAQSSVPIAHRRAAPHPALPEASTLRPPIVAVGRSTSSSERVRSHRDGDRLTATPLTEIRARDDAAMEFRSPAADATHFAEPGAPLSEATVASRPPVNKAAQPVVHVTIDRIEVRAVSPPHTGRPRAPSKAAPAVSLAAYLQGQRPEGAAK